jgi:hypothetical protein
VVDVGGDVMIEPITEEQKKILETPVDGTLRKGQYSTEIYLNGKWQVCQSRVHVDDLQGYIMEVDDGGWINLVLPVGKGVTND